MRPEKPIIIGALGILALMAMGFWLSAREAPEDERTLAIGGTSVRVQVRDTYDERAQGLSGLPGLPEGEGMLFVFEEDGHHSFWMKDMRFSIDIIWISKDGNVVHVEKNVSPETYPTPFTPDSPARYVLEVPAGFAEEHGIDTDSKAALP